MKRSDGGPRRRDEATGHAVNLDQSLANAAAMRPLVQDVLTDLI
jgi:hypothetical protein